MKTGKVELMAPAGSFESLRAGIQAGCDAVYFGIEQLNMRARSSVNFTEEDLSEIVRIAKENDIRTYLTLNTILYDHDIRLMQSIIQKAMSAGVSAIIASDPAVMAYAKSVGMPVHISTQANVTNIETIAFYATFADVIVLARELSLMQVGQICREIERKQIKGPSGELIRIEIFAHGALCMAVSGKCYLSLHTDYASANRGACVQNCRRSYIVKDKEEGNEFEIDNEYIMSAKDLCTIGFLDKVLESGVSVLKIEGRGRAADYVYTTIKCYREAIDALQTNSYTPEKISAWESRLETVYNRGFWDGYYLGRKMGEWNDEAGSKATTKKLYLGRGVKYFDKIQCGEFYCETHSLSVGDKIIITGPTTGYIEMEVPEIQVDGHLAIAANKGDAFTIPIQQKIRPSDKLYKLVAAQ